MYLPTYLLHHLMMLLWLFAVVICWIQCPCKQFFAKAILIYLFLGRSISLMLRQMMMLRLFNEWWMDGGMVMYYVYLLQWLVVVILKNKRKIKES